MSDLALKRQTLRTEFSDRTSIDIGGIRGDIALRDGLDNVAQAIQNRLLTRKGELSRLGHTQYGSRLHTLIGEPKSWKTQARAELYIREALKDEPRIAEILDIQFPEADDVNGRYTLHIVIRVRVVSYEEQVEIALALNLTS
ncbi:MAG: GPW/gp25 family protein [Bacteroidota bacterium]